LARWGAETVWVEFGGVEFGWGGIYEGIDEGYSEVGERRREGKRERRL
jgi:hypothetical protein